MAKDKKTFVLYVDQRTYFDKLSNEDAGKLIKHIFSYVSDENPTPDNIITDLSFEPIKLQLKRDLKKYEAILEKRSKAGKLSAEKRKQESTKATSVESVEHNSTNPTDNDNDNDNDIKYKTSLLSEIKISDVEDNLKPYFTIAVNFQKLFIKNLKEKDASTIHQEKATFKNYVNPIRLMVENKECTIENLREVYQFLDSSKGEFWKTNILSTSKLREKITTLVMNAKAKDSKFKEDKL